LCFKMFWLIAIMLIQNRNTPTLNWDNYLNRKLQWNR
jgi:hypothetical protein